MKKWSFFVMIFLCVCIAAGCAKEQDDHINNNGNSEISSGSEDKKTPENTKIPAGQMVDEKIDDNLYVEAEFHMPEEELYSYSTELKQFDYDKLQSIFWPSVSADQVTTDEFGARYYGDASFGGDGDVGVLNYLAHDDMNYIDTLCSYAKEKNMVSEKDLKFATMKKAEGEVEEFISKLEIGCELGEPFVAAFNGKDLEKIQEKIMKDDEYSSMLKHKKLGNSSFNSEMEIYCFEYPFVLNHIQVFGNDEPPVRYIGDNPLLAYGMKASVIISKTGIEKLYLIGTLNPLDRKSEKAEIIGYEGIKEALEKKFGDVILTNEYKVKKIWMEYFPLIKEDSFRQVEVIPLWCCDFDINGEDGDYTLRFNALTGEEIA